ncbi:GAF domain-containing protein [Shimazuella soli]|uniref:GAF domain-containing protein n=1 Tax=Shimazuella soli TaxID=1892854 RepID=UPI0023AAE0C4|nr:GAF domain-containing protein [Shimazuella soli]
MFHVQQPTGTKEEQYTSMIRQLKSLLEDERDWLANMSNTASFLANTLHEINWVGFYLMKQNELVLGPFMGKPACVRINVGKGVCGTAVAEKQTQVVADVHQFPGHIACDADSRSEIVIPLVVENNVIGVLDIDSPVLNRFESVDKAYLEQLAAVLLEATDWKTLL